MSGEPVDLQKMLGSDHHWVGMEQHLEGNRLSIPDREETISTPPPIFSEMVRERVIEKASARDFGELLPAEIGNLQPNRPRTTFSNLVLDYKSHYPQPGWSMVRYWEMWSTPPARHQARSFNPDRSLWLFSKYNTETNISLSPLPLPLRCAACSPPLVIFPIYVFAG